MERSPRLKCIALGCGVILFYVMSFSMAIKFNCRHCLDRKGTELIWNMENDAPECSLCRERDTYNDGRFFFCKKCRNCSESSVLHNCTLMQDTICEGDAQEKAILKDYDVSENDDPCKYFSDEEDLKRFITTKCREENAECGQPEKEITTESSYLFVILVIVCIVLVLLAIVVISLLCFCWVFRHKFTGKSSGPNPPQKPKDAEGEEDMPLRSSKQKGRHDKDDTHHSESENNSLHYSGYHTGSELSVNYLKELEL